MSFRASMSALLCLLASVTAHADIRIYDVDFQHSQEVTQALSNVLTSQCGLVSEGSESRAGVPACRAQLLPTGQLLVEGPAPTHQQIAAVLEAIAKRETGPTPRVELRYWVLSAVRGAPESDQAALSRLAPVIQQLEGLHGELGFMVEDSVSLVSESGTPAKIDGGQLEVQQEVRSDGRTINGRINLSFRKPETPRLAAPMAQTLDLSVTMQTGEFLVLGERTFGQEGRGGILFYVVHWPEGQ
jgi:hypothetical protein